MTHDSMVELHWQGDIAHIVLTRPQTRNAQDPVMWADLRAAGEQVGNRARVVIVRSLGPSFSAGLDRRILLESGPDGAESLVTLAARGPMALHEFITDAQAAFTWLSTCSAVTIAAVQGHAIGAGFQLALACDLMIVAPDAQLAMPEAALGLVPDLGGIRPLAQRIGPSRALHVCATGRRIMADEAVAAGIAVAMSPDGGVVEAAEGLAQQLCQVPAGSLRELKPLMMGALDRSPSDQLAAERESQIRRILDLTGQPPTQRP